MSRASHAAAFAAGVAIAAAVGAVAAPKRPEATRYKTLDTFAQSLSYVSNQFVEPVDERKLLYAAARGMLTSLDAYSAFFSPAEYRRLREDTDGEFPGVGLLLGPGGDDDAMPDAKEWPIVDEVLAGSPAEKAGIQVDDRILTIDGVATVNPDGTAIKDERYWDGKLRGPSGTRVKVEFLRPGAARVIIIDLRTDSGGLLEQAIAIADQFLESGLIVTIRGRTDAVETHMAKAGGLAVGSRVIVLVNAETASAAEILAGALQDHKRATVIGMRTYGKGAIQTYFDLIDGSGLKLTTHRYLTPSGHQVEGRGITPDIEVPEFEPELVVAGGTKGDASPEPSGKPGGSHDILEARLAEDYQLRIAYQTARGWLGSK